MPDPGKLVALDGYRVQRACATCTAWTGAGAWGGCLEAARGWRTPAEGVCGRHSWAAGAVENVVQAGLGAFLPRDVRPVDQFGEDKALVARLVAIDEGLTEWELGFVASIAARVGAGQALTAAQRERALQIDEHA